MNETDNKQNLTCVIVGDERVGKSCMIISFATKQFPGEYMPTAHGNYSANVKVEEKEYSLEFIDTVGRDEYSGMRRHTYQNADVIIVCFSVVAPPSFDKVSTWVNEIRQHAPTVPFLLVGNMTDLRNDHEQLDKLKGRNLTPISHDQALQKLNEIKGTKYAECSALTNQGLRKVFEEATLLAISSKKKKKSQCIIS